MADPSITQMSGRAMWWWRALLVVLVVITAYQVLIDAQFGILFIWAVPVYQLTRMTPQLRRTLLTGRNSNGG